MSWTQEQISYQKFLATPDIYRFKEFGVSSKTQFVKEVVGVSPTTAFKWTRLPGWIEEVNRLALFGQQHRLGDLYEKVFDLAIDEGNPQMLRLAAELGMDMLNKVAIKDETSERKPEDTAEDALNIRLQELLQKAKKNGSPKVLN